MISDGLPRHLYLSFSFSLVTTFLLWQKEKKLELELLLRLAIVSNLATTFVTIVETFPPFPLVNVGNEKIRPHEETSTLREERGVSTNINEGCSICRYVHWIKHVKRRSKGN